MSLVYHAKLEDAWLEAAKQLQAALQKLRPEAPIGVIGRSKNQKLVLDRDFLIERMAVGNKNFLYKQVSCLSRIAHPLPTFRSTACCNLYFADYLCNLEI